MATSNPALTATDIRHLMGGTHPSVPPELVALYLRAGKTPRIAPLDLHRTLSQHILDITGASGQVAAEAIETVQRYRASRGWHPESYWTRDNHVSYIDEIVAELAPDEA